MRVNNIPSQICTLVLSYSKAGILLTSVRQRHPLVLNIVTSTHVPLSLRGFWFPLPLSPALLLPNSSWVPYKYTLDGWGDNLFKKELTLQVWALMLDPQNP